MQLTRQADYAVRAVLDLSSYPTAHIKDIARRQHIPEAYLQKVLWVLARAGLVQTMRGPRGGVRLTHPPQEINLRQVVEAVQGPIVFTRCLLWAGECPLLGVCPTHTVWQSVQETLIRSLESTTFDILARGAQRTGAEAVIPTPS